MTQLKPVNDRTTTADGINPALPIISNIIIPKFLRVLKVMQDLDHKP